MLSRLINDILDISKIEAGKMQLYLEDFEVRALIEDVVSTVRPLVAKNANELVVNCEAGIGPMHADMMRVRQILFNLLSNASKFTKQGRIELTVSELLRKPIDSMQLSAALRKHLGAKSSVAAT